MAETQTAPKLSLEDYLKKSTLPEAALKPLTDQLKEYNSLVAQVNKWVAQVNAAKAQDPNNVDYLDTLWKSAQATGDEKVKDLADEFDAIAEQYEAKLKELREIAKSNFVPQALSEDETKNVKAKVNTAQPTIAETKNTIRGLMMMVESMLSMQNIELPEGGLISLLPQADSLKNVRGRKAATSAGGTTYMTRVGDVLIDGESTQINGKGKFNYAADKLSERFGKSIHPGNAVTAEELEDAYFNAQNIPPRSLKSSELPDSFTFDFTKETLKPNPNDGEMVKAPVTVKITVISPKAIEGDKPEAKDESKSETKSAEVPAPAKSEPTQKSEPVKIDTRTEAQKQADAKKTAAAPKK